jgi:quinol monooxygenase YgiN
MSIVVVATMIPKPEHRETVIALIEESIARVHAEDEGCELYALHEMPDRLVMIEKWASQQALESHGRGASLTELMPKLADKLAEPAVGDVMTPRPAGSPQLGQL